jgi:hypothetical protein
MNWDQEIQVEGKKGVKATLTIGELTVSFWQTFERMIWKSLRESCWPDCTTGRF